MSHADPFSAETVGNAVLQGADAIVACDSAGIIRFWNAGAARIFGFATAEAVGQSLDIIIPERLRKRHWDGFRRTMQTGQSRYGAGALLSVPSQRKDGAPLSIEFTIVMMKDRQDNISGIIAVMRDVTAQFEEMKALRQQLRHIAPR